MMNRFNSIVRVITGFLFLFLSGNKFGILPTFLNMEGMFTPEGLYFVSAIKDTGYMFETIGVFALFAGIALIVNRLVALAAIVMIPISLNLVLFHVFLGFHVDSIFSFEFARGSIAFIFFTFNVYALYTERYKLKSILSPRN